MGLRSVHIPPVAAVILWLIGLNVAVEGLLQAADHGGIGSTRWRSLAYQYGAFWDGLLHNWRPNYTGQPWLMFLSYALLHGGIGHLLGNMITLVILGRRVVTRLGSARFLLLYHLSAIGGGAVFGVLARSPQPMVGASGALFGLAGAILLWEHRDRKRAGQPTGPVWAVLAGLLLLNLLIWYLSDGLLAWQTHLGGGLAGALCAALLPDRSARAG